MTKSELNQPDQNDIIHEAVTAALAVIDSHYPELKKSAGPFGDRLAGDLHRRIEKAFQELLLEKIPPAREVLQRVVEGHDIDIKDAKNAIAKERGEYWKVQQ